jgi:hypothetical protein
MTKGQSESLQSAVEFAAELAEITSRYGALSWVGLGVLEQLDVMRSLEQSARRVAAADAVIVAQVERDGLAGQLVARSTATLLAGVWNVHTRSASRRVARARLLAPRVTLSGQPLPPLRPALAAAHAAGQIGADHVDVTTAMLHDLPSALPVGLHDWAEQDLTEHAKTINAAQLAGYARSLTDALNPDGVLTEERDQARRRFLSLTVADGGMVKLRGLLDAETGAAAMALLHSLAAPQPARERTSSETATQTDADLGPVANGQVTAAIGTANADADADVDVDAPAGPVVVDDRSASQRLHDGFAAVCRQALQSGGLPGAGGIPATVLITMTVEQFETKTGLVATGFGQRMRVDQALRLADEASIAWIVHNSRGGIVNYGRSRRIASEGQTLALIARDKGCAFPGCTAPPHWTQRHHILPWFDSGDTDLDNMVLLCGYNHRRIDADGWQITVIDGVPYFIPPVWIDPTQTPQRNHAHDAPTAAASPNSTRDP